MAEQEEQRQITVLDAPVPGRSQTGRAVALARLLHHECSQLLQLYVSYQLSHPFGVVTHSPSRYLWLALTRACFRAEAASYLSHFTSIFNFSHRSINIRPGAHCVFERDAVVQSVITLKDPSTPTPTITTSPPFSLGCLMDRVYWIFFLLLCFCASSRF